MSKSKCGNQGYPKQLRRLRRQQGHLSKSERQEARQREGIRILRRDEARLETQRLSLLSRHKLLLKGAKGV